MEKSKTCFIHYFSRRFDRDVENRVEGVNYQNPECVTQSTTEKIQGYWNNNQPRHPELCMRNERTHLPSTSLVTLRALTTMRINGIVVVPLAGMPQATQNFGGTGATPNKPVKRRHHCRNFGRFAPKQRPDRLWTH